MNTLLLGWPLLSCLIFIPLCGAGVLFVLGRPGQVWVRYWMLGCLLLCLGLSTLLWLGFEPEGARFQWVERHLWIPGLNVQYLLAVDGLSVLFFPSTALLFLGVLATLWRTADAESAARLFGWLLVLQSTLFGIFAALDGVLFFAFWEASMLPLYFLLLGWGVIQARSGVAARYVMIMLASGIPLLLVFLLLAQQVPEAGFDVTAHLQHVHTVDLQRQVFLLCLLAFAVKAPLVPLHTWLPQFALAAPGAVTAVLLGLKVGVYGLIRFALPLAPAIAVQWHWLLAGLGTLAILYGAVGMLAQTNLRIGMAYASISHVGLAMLGLASLTDQGVFGAISLLLSFTLASGGALLLLELLRQRLGTTDIQSLGGVAQQMPLLAGGFLVCGLAGVGMPGTSSFPGEYLLIIAALQSHTGAGMAALFGLSIAAGGFLHLYREAFFGPPRHPALAHAQDLVWHEKWLLLVLVGLIFAIGAYPEPWMDVIKPAAHHWVQRFVGT